MDVASASESENDLGIRVIYWAFEAVFEIWLRQTQRSKSVRPYECDGFGRHERHFRYHFLLRHQ